MAEEVQVELADGVYGMWRSLCKIAAKEKEALVSAHEARLAALRKKLREQRDVHERLLFELTSVRSDFAASEARIKELELEMAATKDEELMDK
jgi:hypothetical protein